jgi:hypothetical protein
MTKIIEIIRRLPQSHIDEKYPHISNKNQTNKYTVSTENSSQLIYIKTPSHFGSQMTICKQPH